MNNKNSIAGNPILDTKNVLVRENLLTGDYMVSVKEAPAQMYACTGKERGLSLGNSIQQRFDSGNLIIENGNVLEV